MHKRILLGIRAIVIRKDEVRNMNEEQIHSTVREARNHEMSPIGFTVERLESLFKVRKFPAPGYYLVMSGKPDRQEQFVVREYKAKKHDYETLDRLIRRAFYGSKHIPLRLYQKLTVRLAGKDRIAREFSTSRAITKRRWCATLVPAPDGSPYGLLIFFGISVGMRRGKIVEVLNNPVHSEIAGSFTLTRKRDAR